MDVLNDYEAYIKFYLDDLISKIGNPIDETISKDLLNLHNSVKAKNGGI
jgi:hypothetical protein